MTTATATTAATTVAASTAATGTGLAVSVKAAVLAAGLGLAGLGGAGVVAVVDRHPSLPAREPAPPVVAPAAAPSSSSLANLSSTVPAATIASPTTDAAATATTPSPVTPLPPSRLASSSRPVATPALESSWELPQLEAARAALAAGDADKALTLVEDHARRAPGSALREEGRALAVLALVALGRRDEAQAAATAFATQHPQSLFLPRVRRAVASSTSP
jgi:hypothetical protein